MKTATLLRLQKAIHKQNKACGWHDEPRSFSTFINLFVSELSEALEGDRKNLMDDHLPQYPMTVVELADYSIRVLDYLGLVKNEYFQVKFESSKDFQHDLAELTHFTTLAWYHDDLEFLRKGLALSLRMISDLGYSPVEIITAKVEYNKERADHKRENRAKENGKRY